MKTCAESVRLTVLLIYVRDLAFIWLTKGEKPKYDLGDAWMFVVSGMDKVRKVIEENRKRKLTKHKKLPNDTVIEIDNCSPLEIVRIQKNLLAIAAGEGILRPKIECYQKRKVIPQESEPQQSLNPAGLFHF